MAILVTGAAGFIGRHLVRALSSENRVIGLDDFSSGSRDPSIVEWDLTRPIPDLGCPILAIYHLACPASPKQYRRQPIQTILTNVLGTKHVLDLAREHQARVLLTSSSEVYGQPEVHPQPESYVGHLDFTGPRACYSEGKRMAECLVHEYRRLYQLDLRIVRLFNVYGPGMRADDGRVIPQLVDRALCGRPMTVHGTGKQTRSFTYIDDVIRGLIKIMNSGQPSTTHNLGSEEEVSIEDLARMIQRRLGGSIVRVPGPRDDPSRRRPDLTRIQQDLAWQPTIRLEQGLDLVIAEEKTVSRRTSLSDDRLSST